MSPHERILYDALKTGPKTHLELYRLGIMAHSRAASLRAKIRPGEDILVSREGSEYVYRLVPVGEGRLQAARPSHPSGYPLAGEGTEPRMGAPESPAKAASRVPSPASGSNLQSGNPTPTEDGPLDPLAGEGACLSRGAAPSSASGPPASDPEPVEARSTQLNLNLGEAA